MSGTTTDYVLDPVGLAQVLTATTGGQSEFYVPGLAQYKGSSWEYFTSDRLGSVRQIADPTGTLLLAQSFDPFGNVLEQAGSGSSGFGYTGEQADAAGLVYLRSRYYQPEVGRFLTADSIVPGPLRSAGWNRYAYVGNNPVNYIDPSGHCWGPMSFLRSVPYYDTTCDNLDMAIFIAGHPNATRYQKAQAVSYVEAIAVSHIVLAEALTLAGYGLLLETGLIGGEAYDASQQCHEPSPSFDDPMPEPTHKPSTLQPGPYAGESIPARGPERDLTYEERQEINRIGQTTGCHICGVKEPDTKSGDFIPDHQPPSKLNVQVQ